ncbi:hypothetical protein [Pantoea sp. 18069]|uniref:hypothetical protein n=1 Tax=Pantoea sp. 18069 TaxID=2681415 RepID=UPI00190F6338|nr:hypothetical protein [Pantoea sp. 18069]
MIAKAHSAHLGTSELVGRAIQQAVQDLGLAESVFSLLIGAGRKLGEALMAQINPTDYADARRLIPVLERKAGHILANGFPTGVEVCHAMVHGGPFPSTLNTLFTSVGATETNRFLRPTNCCRRQCKKRIRRGFPGSSTARLRRPERARRHCEPACGATQGPRVPHLGIIKKPCKSMTYRVSIGG